MRRSNVGWIAFGLAFVVVVSFAAEGGFASGHRPADHAAPAVDAHGRALTRQRILVGLAPGSGVADLARELHQNHGQVLDRIGALGVVEVRVPLGRLRAAARAFGSLDSVRYVEREGRAYASDVTPNDPYFPWTGSNVLFGGQWGDGLTQAPKAWDITMGSPNVTVAVVDSGIDSAHPDLAGQVVAGTSIVGGSTTDTHGHGEYVAGVIAPATNNGQGVAGYCGSCKLMPVKITNTSSATYSDMASGIVWATDHGAQVINVSYAGTSSSPTLDSAVSYAASHGAMVVVAAGNSGCDCPTYPAASPGAIAVAASDQADNLMTYSDWGVWVQLAAPTGDITTWLTFNGQPYGYAPVGGTSISAPVVSGIIALMLSADPGATSAQIETALFSTADPITGLTQSGTPVSVKYGRINAYKALMALGVTSPTPSPSVSPSPPPTATASPSVSPTPSAGPSSGPSPTPSPSPSSSPSPSISPTPQVFTYSGSLSRNNPSKTFTLTMPASAVDAQLSFKRCSSLDLALSYADGTLVGEKLGPSVVTLDVPVSAGDYAYTVSAGRCSFTLTVTVTPSG